MKLIISNDDVKLYEDFIAQCPFCGGVEQEVLGIVGKWTVRCIQCDAVTGNKDTEAEAIEAWRRRFKGNDIEEDGYVTWRNCLDRYIREGIGRFIGSDRLDTGGSDGE
ncbi:MAG: hypothetical protein IJJ80_08720 [Clostridia bacterium]|nr:hypothetical protein [Clostridia bacterium]